MALGDPIIGWLLLRQAAVAAEKLNGASTRDRASYEARSRPATAVEAVIDDALQDLEDRGLARAASPLRLTELGHRGRLGGLGAPSTTV